MENYLETALEWANKNHPQAGQHYKCAFANSVSYLITGSAGGYGGPSVREHLVSYALAGDGYNLGGLQFPDGRVKRAGQWNWNEAIAFCEPICFGALPQLAHTVWEQEHCFDDDPSDVAILEG